ncbi:N-acetylglucosamine-1-phosphotransferase subunit gamma-like isoform X2 [Amblyomma americanum]
MKLDVVRRLLGESLALPVTIANFVSSRRAAMEPAQDARYRFKRARRCSIALLLLLSLIVVPVASGSVPMRVVKQSAGLDGLSAMHGQLQQRQLNRAVPRPFSGPEHLKPLQGRCFSHTSEGYRYTLCPFDNATQAEESARWNAYSGILGVWQGWSAANGSLDSMHYGSGDSCGTVNRSVEVRLTCGRPQTSLVEVSEPERCHYTMVLSSPVACHPDSLLVWPILSEHQRQRWSLADSRLYSGETTTKGHAAELAQILWEAGLGVAPPAPAAKPAFANLAVQCHTAYKELDN